MVISGSFQFKRLSSDAIQPKAIYYWGCPLVQGTGDETTADSILEDTLIMVGFSVSDEV